MTPIEKIQLSFRCNMDYEQMKPCSTGRHCSECDKTVIDFRNSDLSHLTKSLEENGNVCGIFTKAQTSVAVNTRTSKFKNILASVLFSLGLGIFNRDLMAQTSPSDSSYKCINEIDTNNYVLGSISEMLPEYKFGGEIGLREFLKKNLKSPDNNLHGKVVVNFTIDTTGKVINAKIKRSLTKEMDEEVLRVVQLLEFTPAFVNGKKIQIQYILPVNFK